VLKGFPKRPPFAGSYSVLTSKSLMAVQPRKHARPSLLSIVVPAYNEEEVLTAFEARARAVCESLDLPYEIVFVNDGSLDGTLDAMIELRRHNPNIGIVNLSRNFGKEIALTAGLDHANGEAILVIDADLQDPPELLGEMLVGWCKGYDIIYAQRDTREGETWLKRQTAAAFYTLMQYIGPVRIPRNTGDFRLISRRVVDALKTMREHHRFMKGLFAWVGFPSISIRYHRAPRLAGQTKWNYWKLWNFSLEGITSFTTVPLRFATYIGFVVSLLAFMYSVFMVFKTLAYGDPVAGFPTLIVAVLFIGGVQLCATGLIGEYVGRVFNETKGRPLYFVERIEAAKPGFKSEAPNATALADMVMALEKRVRSWT
jgi:glycosyltransferase involved in cell wall biosynthesis